MPAFYPRRFLNLESLKRINPANLIALLLPHQEYLAGRGVQIPPADGSDIDYEALVEILVNTDGAMPRELMDSLYFVHEMATQEAMLDLMEAAPAALFAFPAGVEPTPADVAVQVWLKDRDLLERKHSEQFLIRPKSFASYQGAKGSVETLPPITDEIRIRLQEALDDWFDEHKRGRGCRVFAHVRGNEIWFLVRHGEPFRREGAIEDGKSSSVYYRPEKFDVVIYGAELDGLSVNALTKAEKQLYREAFGEHVFGDANYFGFGGRYSLDPLRERGEDVLDCSSVPGIQWIRLKEVEIFQKNRVTVSYSAPDLFSALRHQLAEILSSGFITKASFAVKFVDSKVPRSVSIWQPSRASYMRDEDRLLVEAWMQEQGFLATVAGAELNEEAEAFLAGV